MRKKVFVMTLLFGFAASVVFAGLAMSEKESDNRVVLQITPAEICEMYCSQYEGGAQLACQDGCEFGMGQ